MDIWIASLLLMIWSPNLLTTFLTRCVSHRIVCIISCLTIVCLIICGYVVMGFNSQHIVLTVLHRNSFVTRSLFLYVWILMCVCLIIFNKRLFKVVQLCLHQPAFKPRSYCITTRLLLYIPNNCHWTISSATTERPCDATRFLILFFLIFSFLVRALD